MANIPYPSDMGTGRVSVMLADLVPNGTELGDEPAQVTFVPALKSVVHTSTGRLVVINPVSAQVPTTSAVDFDLLGSDSASMSKTGWTWRVEVELEDGGIITRNVRVAAGGTYELWNMPNVTPTAGVTVTRGLPGAPGVDGADGADGADGSPGVDGAPGAPGVGVQDVEVDSSNQLMVELTDGTFVNAGAISAPPPVDATETAKGQIQLAGDLAGTADAPEVAAVAGTTPSETGLDVLGAFDAYDARVVVGSTRASNDKSALIAHGPALQTSAPRYAFIGDSTLAQGASSYANTWPKLFGDMLADAYIRFDNTASAVRSPGEFFPSITISSTGTAPTPRVGGGTSLGQTDVRLTTADTATYTVPTGCSEVELWFGIDAANTGTATITWGSNTYTFNGAQTRPTNAAGQPKSGGYTVTAIKPAGGPSTITVHPTAGSVWFAAARPVDPATAPVTIWNGSLGGSKVSDWLGTSPAWADTMAAFNPDVVFVPLALNDLVASVPAGTYGTGSSQLVDLIRLFCPGAGIVWVQAPDSVQPDRSLSNYWQQFAQWVLKAKSRVSVFNVSDVLPTLAASGVAGAPTWRQAGTGHYNDAGHRALARAMLTWVGSATPDLRLIFKPSNVSAGTGLTKVQFGASTIIGANIGTAGGTVAAGNDARFLSGGITANRPAHTAGVYKPYYDTTINKLIASNGTDWRDSTGTVV